MAIKTKPQVFETSDGQEFSTAEDAERHEALVTATKAFDEARTGLLRAMADKVRTADGELMDPRRWGDFFYLVGWGPERQVQRVAFYYNTSIAIYDGRVALIPGYDPTNRDGRDRRYWLDELYKHEASAKRALRVDLEAAAAELQERIQGLPMPLENTEGK